MNKLTTILIGTMFAVSAIFTGQSAFATDGIPKSCEEYGRYNVSKFDMDFNGELDKDGDGMICELKKSTETSTSGEVLGPEDPAGLNPGSPGNSGTKGNGGENSSGANPNSQHSQNENGNKTKQLANTGWAATWAGIGGLALLFGLVFTFFAKRKKTA